MTFDDMAITSAEHALAYEAIGDVRNTASVEVLLYTWGLSFLV